MKKSRFFPISFLNYFIFLGKEVFPEKMLPMVSSSKMPDCILAFTFGRNSVRADKLYRVAYLFRTTYSGSSKKTVRRILNTNNFDPGKSNISLAQDVISLVEIYHIPAIVQWEIVIAMGKWYLENTDKVIPIWPDLGRKSQNTMEVLWQLEKLKLLPSKFKMPIVVSQKYHMTRAFLLVKKFLGYIPVVAQYNTGVFDPGSVQWWTRSKLAWYCKEFLVRIHHVIKGWV